MDKKQFDKLPNYVKREINRLNKKIERLTIELRQMSSNDYTNVICTTGITNNKIALPKDSQITFFAGNSRFDISVVDNELRIYGATKINIVPRAANSIYIYS